MGPKHLQTNPSEGNGLADCALGGGSLKGSAMGPSRTLQQPLPKVSGLPRLFKQRLPSACGLVSKVARDGECATWKEGTGRHVDGRFGSFRRHLCLRKGVAERCQLRISKLFASFVCIQRTLSRAQFIRDPPGPSADPYQAGPASGWPWARKGSKWYQN